MKYFLYSLYAWISYQFCAFIDRAEYGEKTVQKLNLRIDNIMVDLVAEKMQTQTVNDQLDETFELFMGH